MSNTPPVPPVNPVGKGDITDPGAWQDNAGNVPPLEFENVPQNQNFPLNGDGRYWWTGNQYTNDVLGVVFLAPLTGANGATLFPAFPPNADMVPTLTPVISTAQAKFGNGSLSITNTSAGTPEYISTPIIPGSQLDLFTGASSFTMAGWFFLTAGAFEGVPLVVMDYGSTSYAESGLYLEATPAGMYVSSPAGASSWGAINAAAAITQGVWHHFALVRNGAALKLYLDGVLIGTTNIAGATVFGSAPQVYIGGTPGITGGTGDLQPGFISDIVIFNYAKYLANFTPPMVPYQASTPQGTIYFIGNPADLADTIALGWQLTALSNDGSIAELLYSTDGGLTFETIVLPLGLQGLQSGTFNIDLLGSTGIAVAVNFVNGNASATATMTEVAVSITRNANSAPVWDSPNALDPTNYNSTIMDTPGYDSLSTLQTRMMIRLGFSNQTDNFPPGMEALLQEFLQSSQNFLYRRFSQLRTRRWFRWKVIPNQRFYGLLDNDENILQGYALDPNKVIIYVGIQDSRNVWYPLVEGIPPEAFTMLAKPWRPARYEIRDSIELYPVPDQTYWLWIKGHFGLQSFSNPDDITTIDSELVYLNALANAKAHYGQPDANNIESQANALRSELCASTHKTNRYIPGTQQVPPAVRPTLIHFDGDPRA
jgi:hypothetical protein